MVRQWYGVHQRAALLLLWKLNMVVAMEGFRLLLPNASSATWGSLFCIPELNVRFGLGVFLVRVLRGFFSCCLQVFFP